MENKKRDQYPYVSNFHELRAAAQEGYSFVNAVCGQCKQVVISEMINDAELVIRGACPVCISHHSCIAKVNSEGIIEPKNQGESE